ncbi:MAG TPA: endonuclease/exonuclease/phosphatase family protein [Actinopolymorphaceae bacterium]
MLRPELDEPAGLLPVIGPVEPSALHVMSFNLRNAGVHNPDPWPGRRPVASRLLRAERPTIIGTQEGLYQQVREVAADLPEEYDWIGTGREGGSRGEFMAIFFDTGRLEPLAFDHFWLSDTPDVVGSATWGNQVVRMATWVRFLDRRTQKRFVVLNTHLDHAVGEAQQRGAELLVERLTGLAAEDPVIVTGDFNVAAESSSPYRTLVEGAELADSWLTTAERQTPTVATFHGYRDAVPDGDRIDWILVRPDIRVKRAAINTYYARPIGADDAAWASDHWPVQAVVELP